LSANEIDQRKLDQDILTAHKMGDGIALVELYEIAGRLKDVEGDNAAASFLFTQAYVFGLETGHPRSPVLKRILAERGCED